MVSTAPTTGLGLNRPETFCGFFVCHKLLCLSQGSLGLYLSNLLRLWTLRPDLLLLLVFWQCSVLVWSEVFLELLCNCCS